MIGSYAYARSVPGMEKLSPTILKNWFGNDSDRILMVDIFHSSHGIPARYDCTKDNIFDRFQFKPNELDKNLRRACPDNLIKLHNDGHIDTSKTTKYVKGQPVIAFRWSSVLELNTCMSVEDRCTPAQRADALKHLSKGAASR